MKPRFWIARDKNHPMAGSPKCICLFVGERPELVERAFWYQPNNRSGRYPIPKCGFRIKPGEVVEVEIRKKYP